MIVVQVRGDLDPHMSRSHHARHDGLDVLPQAVLEIGGVLFRIGAGFAAVLVVAAGEQIALVVDDGHARRLHPCHRRRHEMLNGRNLATVQHAAGLEHHRTAGILRLVREDLPLRDHQMNARAVDALDGLDRAGELAFQGAHAVDVLYEGGGAEGVGFVENLVADAGGRKIFGSELHPQLGDLIGGHQDGAAVALHVVGHIHRVELGRDLRGVARLDPCK